MVLVFYILCSVCVLKNAKMCVFGLSVDYGILFFSISITAKYFGKKIILSNIKKVLFSFTGISCIVKPRINSGISCIRLIFFLFGNKIASLFDQKFRMKYLLFKKTRRAFSSIPIPKPIYLIIIMHACLYKMDTSIQFWYTRMRIHIEKNVTE